MYPHMVFFRVCRARAPRRNFSSVKEQNAQFKSLFHENDQLLPKPVVTQRVLEYLLVDHKDVKRVLLAKELRPLSYKTLFVPQRVQRLTPLVHWGFKQLENEPHVADAVFTALEPHANMAGSTVWQQYFQRQFFLSGAPLPSYLLAYKIHSDALAAARKKAEVEVNKGKDQDQEKNEEKARRENLSKSKAHTILTENKEWEWVSVYVASNAVKELCFRGRFAEAIEAYAALPLADTARQEVVTILHDYEQYSSVLYLYALHRAMGDAIMPLDVALELDALRKVGRVDEMDMRFQELPVKEQSRADIQKLMGN